MPKGDQQDQCEHIAEADLEKSGNTEGCEECEKTGSDWVHLRLSNMWSCWMLRRFEK